MKNSIYSNILNIYMGSHQIVQAAYRSAHLLDHIAANALNYPGKRPQTVCVRSRGVAAESLEI